MPVTYKNYYGDIYYLIKKKTKKGNWRYYFSKSKGKGELADSIPEGYEIDEKPNGNVYLVKETPELISDEEISLIENSVKKYSDIKYFRVYVKGEKITIYIAQDSTDSLKEFIGPFYDEKKFRKYLTFSPMLRFILVDKTERIFEVERYCFRGGIDDWILLDGGNLKEKVKQYCKHLGKDSFYELI